MDAGKRGIRSTTISFGWWSTSCERWPTTPGSRLLWTLVDGELSVNELAAASTNPAPSVSQHLAKLRMARLAKTRRAGTTIFYSLDTVHVQRLVIDAVYNAEHAGTGVPAHHRADADVQQLATHRDRTRRAGQR